MELGRESLVLELGWKSLVLVEAFCFQVLLVGLDQFAGEVAYLGRGF